MLVAALVAGCAVLASGRLPAAMAWQLPQPQSIAELDAEISPPRSTSGNEAVGTL
jgi:hypothetical protein